MPNGPVPERFHGILESTVVGHLATVGSDGRPQVNPVWFLWDGVHLLLSVRADTVKYRNLRRDPRLAISIADQMNPGHYLELRGEVAAFEEFRTLEFVDQLSMKYAGKPMARSEEGRDRYKLTVRVESWTGQ